MSFEIPNPMDRIEKELEAKRIEEENSEKGQEKKKLLDGIKRRLNEWQKSDLIKLRSHLGRFRGSGHSTGSKGDTLKESWTELFEQCKEGTEEGRTIGGGNVSRDPDMASVSLLERLAPAVIHDDFEADNKITVAELLKAIEEIL